MVLPGIGGKYSDSGAEFDEPDRLYRYRLWRRWAVGSYLLWIMLNPSTADEYVLDATLRKVEGFTRRWGYAGFEVANAFALRSTDPRALYTGDVFLATSGIVNVGNVDPVGECDGGINDRAIVDAAARCHAIVVGWGKEKIAQQRGAAIAWMLDGRTLACLGTNKDGSPKHPLYVPYTAQLVEWKAGA